jgi:hypothetical protein
MTYTEKSVRKLIGKNFIIKNIKERMYIISAIVQNAVYILSYKPGGGCSLQDVTLTAVVDNFNTGTWILYEKFHCGVCE